MCRLFVPLVSAVSKHIIPMYKCTSYFSYSYSSSGFPCFGTVDGERQLFDLNDTKHGE